VSRVSKRYAKALFALSEETGKLDGVAADMEQLGETLRKSGDFFDFIKNPLISINEKEQTLDTLFKASLQGITLDFLHLLCRKKRLNVLDDIVDDFAVLMMEHRHQLKAEIVSAQPLDAAQADAIKKRLQELYGKEVLVSLKEDVGLIGGFRVFINGQVIDNSIRYQLNKLKEQLVA